MATRGVMTTGLAVLASLASCPGTTRGDELVQLTRWADEGVVVRGAGMGDDVFRLIAEATWDRAASRDPARYRIRVAFADGRVEARDFPVDYPPGRNRFSVYVPARAIRDLVPSTVTVAVAVVDAASGTPVSNTLTAGIDQFPRPRGDTSASDPGPFGRGTPLQGTSRILPVAGPDGLRFARVVGVEGSAGFFLATAESTIGQVAARLPGYDPKAGRSDEFSLEDPNQPALNLTASKAQEYLLGLSKSDPSGLTYRLPTAAEWLRAATSGKPSAFWWGDEPRYPEGANLLGPEPALAGDATASSMPGDASPTFAANPSGFFHTFGNVAEWAVDPSGGFARMGGHFRTEPASPLPSEKVEAADQVGPDPFVGVRAAFDLSGESASALIKQRLAAEPKLAGVGVAFDPDTATATLTGPVADTSARRSADRILEGLWFVAAVDNRLETPALLPNQLAIIGPPAGPARRVGVLDRSFVEVPMAVRWLDPLPVQGSTWWVNIFLPGGAQLSHKLDATDPGRANKIVVRVDRDKLAALGVADNALFRVALSLGSPAPTMAESRVVSNTAEVRPTLPPGGRSR